MKNFWLSMTARDRQFVIQIVLPILVFAIAGILVEFSFSVLKGQGVAQIISTSGIIFTYGFQFIKPKLGRLLRTVMTVTAEELLVLAAVLLIFIGLVLIESKLNSQL